MLRALKTRLVCKQWTARFCHLHIGNVGVAHQRRHVRHTTAAAKVLGHLSQLGVAHEVAEHVGVAHQVLSHAREHGVAHDGSEIGHTTAATATTTAQHASKGRQIGHAASTTGCSSGIIDLIGRRLGATLGLLDLLLGGLKTPLHSVTTTVALGLDTLLVRLLGTVVIGQVETSQSQTAPGLGVLGVHGGGKLGILRRLLVLSGCGIGSSPVGEVDRVGGSNGQGLGVQIDGSGIVLASHGTVALRLQLIRLGRRGTRLGLLFTGLGRVARGLVPQLLVDTVDAGQRLSTQSILHSSLVRRVDLEGIGNAGLGDLDGFGVIGGQGAILQAGTEEVDDGERQALLGLCGGLESGMH
ncbi:hypothetical protein BO94DRAFT_121694 [Aspergillus sclerotioniger CBS 115572]|uniref:Uncharacterized protein n=1 Tax=Aspergillus sclerotioniger CBS 115572 TaxID=1450535 RepID=A0A317WDS8_9EURO|nr:hypothetical protein BO94DRAFT_121694 [Aspergillus sclerotioniger CBS 115572]PWY83218.1 hypothetical protein BO94DRAFT_121694 [Aspergillus sclerotioniger CBS 115572]